MRHRPIGIALRMVVVALLAASAGGCSKKAPQEANDALDASLKALAKGDSAGFAGALVPAQKDKASALPEWPFFQAVKSHTIDNEFDTEVTAESAKIMATIYLDTQAKKHTNLAFSMKKVDGQWRIDLDQTIKDKKATDGARAFREVYEFVPKTPPTAP
ncbi:MAG: hypothetical protein NTV86_11160 [Planctomycetota bacterium]|nr:hypothetical protein [Planctomycetota bacterium]